MSRSRTAPAQAAAIPRALPSRLAGAARSAGGLLARLGELAEAVVALAAALPADVLDVLLIAHGRWSSLLCHDPACCPAQGTPLPVPGSSSFAASAAFAGLPVLPSREQLAEQLAPVPGRERLLPLIHSQLRAMQPELGQLESGQPESGQSGEGGALAGESARGQLTPGAGDGSAGEFLDAAESIGAGEFLERQCRWITAQAHASSRPGWAAPGPLAIARLVAALHSTPIRDAVWTAIDAGQCDGSGLWRYLAKQAPAPYDAAPAFLLGWQAWRGGNGALANIAADRALEADPHYGAAELLITAISAGVDPRHFPRLRA